MKIIGIVKRSTLSSKVCFVELIDAASSFALKVKVIWIVMGMMLVLMRRTFQRQSLPIVEQGVDLKMKWMQRIVVLTILKRKSFNVVSFLCCRRRLICPFIYLHKI